MLKRLITSKARIKLLQTFILNPDEEFFIRELTRKLDEQINSIRRELDNLKRMGLLRSRVRNRKKYYVVNKGFIFFNELRSILLKAGGSSDHIAKRISKMGRVDLLLFSGLFVDRPSPADLLLVGDVDKEELANYLTKEVDTERPIKFSAITRDDFLYRLKCHDKFVTEMIKDQDNIVAINKLGKYLESPALR